MVDFLGHDIKVGDRIVYPNRRGANLWMNKGIVEGFGVNNSYFGRGLPTLRVRTVPAGKLTTITENSRVVVIPTAGF
jgi:hypothetical protein